MKVSKLLKARKSLSIIILMTTLITINTIIFSYAITYDLEVKNELQDLQLDLNVDFSTLNSSRWVVPSFQHEDFLFEIETGTESNPWYENVTRTVNYYNMGTTNWFKANCTQWGEWGYSFHHLTNGMLDGSGVAHYGGYPIPPKNKLEAFNYIKQYVINFTKHLNNNTRPWISFNGHYPYHHYAAEFGFDKIGSEIGENMESYQMLLAFNRGAARQYHRSWFVDFSAWYGPGFLEYNEPPIFPQYGGANNGHSLSLFKRSYYISYMAGASRLIAEGGYINYFYLHEKPDNNGIMQLTPLGEIGREFARFTRTHPDRGIPYAPIAIYIDELHGTTGLGEPLAFNSIPYTGGDWMTYNLLEILFPGGWNNNGTEQCQLVNNKFGDIFDIILQNASQDVLNSYPVIIMSGDITLDPDERRRIINYVLDGGTLIANSACAPALQQELNSRNINVNLEPSLFQRIKLIRFDNINNGGNIIITKPDHDAFKS
ncbi:MAG: hypothetical protein ACTSWN_12470, partial [Promethearchaeota archaeon]